MNQHDGRWTGETPLFASSAPTSSSGEEAAEKVNVGSFRFDVSAPLGCTRLCVGETAVKMATPRQVTAKVVEPEDLQEFLGKEGRVLHTLHNRPHPGFPKLHATVTGDDGRSFIVMDELGMDLNTYVRAEGGLPEEEVKVLFRQIVSAVAHCHKNRIVLRDMKLGKIFYSNAACTNLVFADLDGSEVMTGSRIGQLRDQKGSPAYVCPEVLCCKPYNGYAADMWGLGVVLFRMLAGSYPFHDSEPARLFDKILLGSSAINFPDSIPTAARNVIRRLLERNPQSRPDAATLLQHPWLQHDRAEGMATLRRRSLSSSLLSPTSSVDAEGARGGGAAGSSSVGGDGVQVSRGSEDSSMRSVEGFNGSGSRLLRRNGSGSRLLRRRSSSASLTSEEGEEMHDDGDEQLVPAFDDANDGGKEPITPKLGGKSFGNLGGGAATETARHKPASTSSNPFAAEKRQASANKRPCDDIAGSRVSRRKLTSTRTKSFVRPAGLVLAPS